MCRGECTFAFTTSNAYFQKHTEVSNVFLKDINAYIKLVSQMSKTLKE